MAHIQYSTTNFVKPSQIDRQEYNRLKLEISKNSNFEIVPEGESFSEHFADLLKIIKICLGIIIGLLFISYIIGVRNRNPILGPIIGIALLALFFSIIPLILEGPSFAKFKRQKRKYFNDMSIAIQQTDSYNDFLNSFYKR